MPTNTYTPIASVTLSATASEVVFTGLPQTFRDLILVVDGNLNLPSDGFIAVRFNGDTGTNYNSVYAANASSAARTSVAGIDLLYGATTARVSSLVSIMDYTQTNKQKTALVRSGNNSDSFVFMSAARWANTNAINSISVLTTTTGFASSGSLASGTTLTIFGVIA